MQTAITGDRPVGRRVRARRGLSLLIVMVALSTSVVLAYSFLRTQIVVARISDNGARRDLALQAAQAGAADGLARLQSPNWQGIDQTITEVLIADASGTASYSVAYLTLAAAGVNSPPTDEPLYLVIRSTGLWQSAVNSQETVQRQVDVTVRLSPRLPGRTINAGDSSIATDVTPNPADYDRIQGYTLFARNGSDSLILDPQDRIDGPIWLKENLRLYHDPRWDHDVRNEMLTSIGAQYGPTANGIAIRHPHPLAGTITFQKRPSNSVRNDLDRLKVTWLQDQSTIVYPTVDPASWQTYRLYAGGPLYSATSVAGTLINVTLRPTPENPLGIFYRSGSVWVSNNVTIQGTLVCTGDVIISGNEIRLCSFNWLDSTGGGLVRNAKLWPRLPAVVANGVSIGRNVRVGIEGAIVVARNLDGAGGDFEYVGGSAVTLSGTATSRPLIQPYSSVQLAEAADLTAVSDTGVHSIWLQDGSTGSWYSIVGVDRSRYQLTVVGEVQHETPTTYRIGRTRLRSFDLRGPVFGKKFNINRPPAWSVPSEDQWDRLHSNWEQQNAQLSRDGGTLISFVDWLANPTNFAGWTYPLSVYGLGLEPTFHLKNTTGITYLWSPPLFTPYAGTGSDTTLAGYRWQVISWREVR